MEFKGPLPGMVFVEIPGGFFQMGSPDSEPGRTDDEGPQHRVLLPSFRLMTTPVTEAQWKGIMGRLPKELLGVTRGRGDDVPISCISWLDSIKFTDVINRRFTSGSSSDGYYRLPTEAEWEYACRAGSTTAYCFGDDEERLGDYAWYKVNSGSMPHPVGQKLPNAWGLFDMHGNVEEWCLDGYQDYTASSVYNPKHEVPPSTPVMRGGGYSDLAKDCRSASRNITYDHFYCPVVTSFRLAYNPPRRNTPF